MLPESDDIIELLTVREQPFGERRHVVASLDLPLCSVGINVIAIDFEKQSGFSHSLLVGHGIQPCRVSPSHVVVVFETKASPFQIQYARGFQMITDP